MLWPDGILGTQDSGPGPDFGAMFFFLFLNDLVFPSIVTLAQMASLNNEPGVFSIIFCHCKIYWLQPL